HGFVSHANVHAFDVGFRVDRNRPDAEFAAGADDADGDFASISYQDFTKHDDRRSKSTTIPVFAFLWLDNDRIRWSARIVAHDDLFSGGVIVGTLLLEITQRLCGFVLHARDLISVVDLKNLTVIVGNGVDDLPVH